MAMDASEEKIVEEEFHLSLSPTNALLLKKINSDSKLIRIPVIERGRYYGVNLPFNKFNQYIIDGIYVLAQNGSPEDSFHILTVGCGSEGYFEMNALMAGQASKRSKVTITMTDVLEPVVKSAARKVSSWLATLKVPETPELFRSCVYRVPEKMTAVTHWHKPSMIYSSGLINFLKEEELKSFFSESYKNLKSNGNFVLSCSAPSSREMINLYERRLKEHSSYPGFMTVEKVHATVKSLTAFDFNKNYQSAKATDFPGKRVRIKPKESDTIVIKTPADFHSLLEREGLKPGQVDPNIANMQGRLFLKRFKISLVVFDLPFLANLARTTGFKIIECHYFNPLTQTFHDKGTDLSKTTYHCILIAQKP